MLDRLMNMKTTMLLIALVMLSFSNYAFELKGFVKDSNGEGISYASVFILNSTYGVSANYNGEYHIELDKGKHKMVFEALGYTSDTVDVNITSNASLDITLKDHSIELGEIEFTVDQEDPAYPIIRKAIEYKKNANKDLISFTCNSYLKSSIEKVEQGVILLGQDKLNFVESYSKVDFKAPNRTKEEIIAYNDHSKKSNNQVTASIQMGNDYEMSTNLPTNPDLFYSHYSDASFDFYQNLMFEKKLSETPLTSPLSNTAFTAYKYEFVETFYNESTPIHKIKVKPRRDNGALFSGIIYINGNNYSLSKVELSINSQVLSYYRDFKIIQEYTLIDGYSLPIRREFHFTVGRQSSFKAGITAVVHSDYQINVEHPKNHFQNVMYVTLDDAYDYSLNQWDSIRPITLKEEEQNYVFKQDSMKQFYNSPEFLDSMDQIQREFNWQNVLLSGMLFRNRIKGTEYYIDPIINSVHPFSVGGYRHSMGGQISKEWSKAYKLENDGNVSFGINNFDLKGELKTKFTYAPKKFAKLMVKGGNIFDMITYQQNISNIFARSNFVEKTYFGFGHEIELINGLFFDFETEYAKVNSIEGYTLANWSNELFPENTPESFDTYTELFVDINLSFRFRQKYFLEPYKKVIIGSDFPVIDLHYKKGVPNLFNSIVDFDYIELKIKDDIQFGKIGNSRYRVRAGTFASKDNIRILDYKFFRGSDRYFFSDPLNTFQLLGPTLSSSNSFVQGHYVHHFNGFFLNQVPLINKLKLGTVAGAGGLMMKENSFKHIEMYVGLEKPFRIRKSKYKLSVFYVVADSNYSTIDSGFKFGIDMYNFFTNKWTY